MGEEEYGGEFCASVLYGEVGEKGRWWGGGYKIEGTWGKGITGGACECDTGVTRESFGVQG